ncbi:MAG: ABC transporter ATP-binding protein [Pseudomonadota bacterium]|nr:ABC transporter ATP-binding protein [Pseudomonadota bacterium]
MVDAGGAAATAATAGSPAADRNGGALLRGVALTRRFGGVAAVDGVSIELRVGVIHAVIGTNGAGKSTLVNLLSGELAPSQGRVFIGSDDVTGWPQPRRARAGLGRTYQRSTIFGEFSVLENCRLAAQARRPQPWRIWRQAGADAAGIRDALAALEATGLAGEAPRIAGTLSHGGKRQLEIAMCLATAPRALLLDEPLAGMGAEESTRMLELLAALRPSHAILLVEHDMDAVFRIADRITVMVNGQVIASDVPDRIRADRAVQDAYLGEDPLGAVSTPDDHR